MTLHAPITPQELKCDLETCDISAISNRIEILRQVLEEKAELKGYNDPEVLHLSQKLDRYIAAVLSQQLRDYQSKSGRISNYSTGS